MQELLTSGDVAERFGVSRQSVNNWVEWGWLEPAYELTNGRLFTRAEVERFAAEREQAV
jgi:DNA-binding transcriptional MerR regulator